MTSDGLTCHILSRGHYSQAIEMIELEADFYALSLSPQAIGRVGW